MSRYEWKTIRTEYREVRASAHGDELRYILNRETIRDTTTGRTVTRAIVRHLGVCVIVPFLTEERIVLVRQYRGSIDRALWELPAGTLAGREDQGRVVATETPAACAARELREETGYAASRLDKVAELVVMPGGNEQISPAARATAHTRLDEPGTAAIAVSSRGTG